MKRLIIDTETTGLSPYFNKTLTVGLLLIEVEKTHLNILDKNHIFIKHKNYNINPQALKVNKINIEEHNINSVNPSKACNQINKFIQKNSLEETPLVGHNIGFDKGFLSALFKQGDSIPLFHHISEDTLAIWRNLQRENKIPCNLSGKLDSIANHFEIDCTKAHDALGDCHITAQIYHKMIKLQ
jgi:DNA polymerase III alpha subunit (gram-positive type)